MEIAYCIEHQHSVLVQNSIVGELHEVWGYNEFGMPDIDWCDFPKGWATVEPVENPDWDLDLVEPSDEELELMNVDAECILS